MLPQRASTPEVGERRAVRDEDYLDQVRALFARSRREGLSVRDALAVVIAADRDRRRVSSRRSPGRTHGEQLLALVAERRGLTVEQLLCPAGRQPHRVESRWIAMRLLRDDGFSDLAIARLVNRRRCAVQYGLAQIRLRLDLLSVVRDCKQAKPARAVQ